MWGGFQQKNPFARSFFCRCRNDLSERCWCHKSHQGQQPWGWGAGINPCPAQSQLWTGFPKAVPFLGQVTNNPRCFFLSFHQQEEIESKGKLSKLSTFYLGISPLGMFSTNIPWCRDSPFFPSAVIEPGIGILYSKISQDLSPENPRGCFCLLSIT